MFSPEAMAGYASTAFFTIINLMVTYFVLKRFLFKPILNVLRKRKVEVETELAEAEEKLKSAADKLAHATDRLSSANHEAAGIVTAARSQSEILRESLLSDAKRDISGMYSRADMEIGRMRVTMLNDVRNEIADLSVAVASKVIGQTLDEQHQKDMVSRFLDEELRAKRGEK